MMGRTHLPRLDRKSAVWLWQAVTVADRHQRVRLLDDEDLAGSAVVANCAMNRERQLTGVNSYTRELGFDPVEVLAAAPRNGQTVAWLDLCCGTARALIQAADRLTDSGLAGSELVGVDLVDAFDSNRGLSA
jgi:hypothetical protein